MQQTFIAELKTSRPEEMAFLLYLANRHGDVISIHTESPYGSRKLLKAVREGLPENRLILAKGTHTFYDDFMYSLTVADYVLTTKLEHALAYPKQSLYEPLDYSEFIKAKEKYPWLRMVWNTKMSPNDPRRRIESFECVRRQFDGWLCQASLIQRKAGVNPQADAFIVGAKLDEFLASSWASHQSFFSTERGCFDQVKDIFTNIVFDGGFAP